MNTQDWSLLGWTGWISLQSKGLSKVFSNTAVQKHQLFTIQPSLATHSSVLGWRIPGTGEPGGLPSMGLHRVGYDWSDLAAAAVWIQLVNLLLEPNKHHLPPSTPAPVLLPGKSHGWRSLVVCSPWGREELDTTERLHFHALEKEMATHSSVLGWRIPGMGELGGLPSTGSHRVRHDWHDLAAAAAAALTYKSKKLKNMHTQSNHIRHMSHQIVKSPVIKGKS